MKTLESYSTVKPSEWDTESCPDIVYHNIDVRAVPAAGEIPNGYAYTQEQYTRAEYETMQREERLAAIEETQDSIMLALTTIYESEATV